MEKGITIDWKKRFFEAKQSREKSAILLFAYENGKKEQTYMDAIKFLEDLGYRADGLVAAQWDYEIPGTYFRSRGLLKVHFKESTDS